MPSSIMYSSEECIRSHQASGVGGLPLVDHPDSVTRDMAQLAALGFGSIAISFVNHLDELSYFCVEVLRPWHARGCAIATQRGGRIRPS